MAGKGQGKGKAPPLPPPTALGSGKGQGKAAPKPHKVLSGAPAKSADGQDIASVKLKPTKTRVRHRDGTVICETRSPEGFQAELLTLDAAVPQYVQDQEAGLSRLEPKVFDPVANRWRPQVLSCKDDGNMWLPDWLRLVTYNVWFSSKRQRARAAALFKILEESNADIICLQEVTPQFLNWLRDQEWLREAYALSDAVGTTLRGAELIYGVIMLLKRQLPVMSLNLHALPTRMNRSALVATLALAGGAHELRIATAHLESLDNQIMRSRQLEQIFQVLLEDNASTGRYGAGLLAGDMNFDAGCREDNVAAQAGFSDNWRSLSPCLTAADAADRGITMPCSDENELPARIDRVFSGPPSECGARWSLWPQNMCRLGMQSFMTSDVAENISPTMGRTMCVCGHFALDAGSDSDPDMPQLVPVGAAGSMPKYDAPWNRPSDHFGLLCDFKVHYD